MRRLYGIGPREEELLQARAVLVHDLGQTDVLGQGSTPRPLRPQAPTGLSNAARSWFHPEAGGERVGGNSSFCTRETRHLKPP